MLFKVLFLVALSLAMFLGAANSDGQKNDVEKGSKTLSDVVKILKDSSKGIKYLEANLQDFPAKLSSDDSNVLQRTHCEELLKLGFCRYSLIRKKFCPRTCSACNDVLGKPCCNILREKKECGTPLTMKYCYKTCHNCFSCLKSAPLGMQNRKIPDSKITASSMYDGIHAPPQGRLHYRQSGRSGAWCARRNRAGEWIQVDLGTVTKVTAVATQGRYDTNQWVTRYSLQYSLDGKRFTNYEEGKIFTGNRDRHGVVKHVLQTPMVVRYIRLVVRSWYSHISLRMELYGCR